MQNCFVMPSRLKSHIILVLDRLQCVARVNCLVSIKIARQCCLGLYEADKMLREKVEHKLGEEHN